MYAHDELAEGRLCTTCGDRLATMVWSNGGAFAVVHGSYEFRCDICALTEQLEYARERAESIPDLEEQLASAWAKATTAPLIAEQ